MTPPIRSLWPLLLPFAVALQGCGDKDGDTAALSDTGALDVAEDADGDGAEIIDHIARLEDRIEELEAERHTLAEERTPTRLYNDETDRGRSADIRKSLDAKDFPEVAITDETSDGFKTVGKLAD